MVTGDTHFWMNYSPLTITLQIEVQCKITNSSIKSAAVNFDQIMMLQLLRDNYYILKKNYFRIIFDINI